MENPKLTIAIPYYDTPKTAFFLSRLFSTLSKQTFTDYEIVLTNEPGMAHNHNAAMLKGKGEIIKLMQMDDYFADGNSLQDIIDNFKGEWMITGCAHTEDGHDKLFNQNHPEWTDDIFTGNNKLGGLSTLAVRRETLMLFDESLMWTLDCDLYKRYKDKYGLPTILDKINVIVDVGDHRVTRNLDADFKIKEMLRLIKKYDTTNIQ